MAGSRGVAAFRQQAEAAKERRSAGWTSILIMKAGDQVRVRFRGLFEDPAQKLTETQIRGLDPDWLGYFCWVLGIPTEEKIDELVEAIARRYTQMEPFTYVQHYIHGLKGKEGYPTCACAWDPALPCVECWLKSNGDKRISTRSQAVFTVQPIRKIHIIERVGGKKEYPICPALDGEHCKICVAAQKNPKIEAKWESIRYLSLAPSHAEGLLACVERVRKRCVVCSGMGQIRHVGYQCSNGECGEPLAYKPPEPMENPPADYMKVTCPECRTIMVPEEIVKCSRGCEGARRAQMHDVDVLIQRVGGDKTTTYQFTEQWPAEPLDPELLKKPVPAYEFALKPVSVEERCRALGLTENPFTGTALAAPPNQQTSSYEEAGDGEATGDPYGETAGEETPPAADEDIPF